jgi:hypothetical protein
VRQPLKRAAVTGSDGSCVPPSPCLPDAEVARPEAVQIGLQNGNDQHLMKTGATTARQGLDRRRAATPVARDCADRKAQHLTRRGDSHAVDTPRRRPLRPGWSSLYPLLLPPSIPSTAGVTPPTADPGDVRGVSQRATDCVRKPSVKWGRASPECGPSNSIRPAPWADPRRALESARRCDDMPAEGGRSVHAPTSSCALSAVE